MYEDNDFEFEGEGDDVARARTTDPTTAHDAASQVTKKRQDDLIWYIHDLVAEFPDIYQRHAVNVSMERLGMDGGWYGTLGTNFSKAEAAGLIYVSGTTVSDYTQREVQTYRACTPEKAASLKAQAAQAVADKQAASQAKRDAKKVAQAAAKAEAKKLADQEKLRKAKVKLAKAQILRGLQIEHTRALALRDWTRVAELSEAISNQEKTQ